LGAAQFWPGWAIEEGGACVGWPRFITVAVNQERPKMRFWFFGQNGLIRVLLGLSVYLGLFCGAFSGSWTSAFAQSVLPTALYPVGMTMVEYVDPAEGGRPLDYMLIYPANPDRAATPFKIFLYDNLHLYKDAPVVADGLKRPLVIFSHGAGGNGSGYAWFGEYLAARGYLVAMVYHYRANTYDTSALYVRNRLWQRPRDIGLDITHLLHDKDWGPHIDPNQIGVAGHSQGGFTSLWIGGAQVNPDLFLKYLGGWKNNQMVPAYLRAQMRVDAEPARDVRDRRVKAAFAMAPGDIQGFGMDEAGLRQMDIPAYIIVGAGDTTTPPSENAAFAAKFIPHAQLDVLQGAVGHEIFGNECDQLGRDNYPESCVDAPGVDRARLHQYIGGAAVTFFDANLGVRRESLN
jgi:predicted dienelactone hydrolase